MFANSRNNFSLPRFIFVVLIIASVAGCHSQRETYRKEAKAFCDVHNPENWKAFAKTGSLEQLPTELNHRIHKVVHTEAFKNIVAELNQIRFLRQLYPGAQTKITQLTGEQWDCSYYQAFYSVKFERISDDTVTAVHNSAATAKDDKNVIVVGIDTQGNYTVNSMELMDNSPQTLQQAIKTVAASTKPYVIISKVSLTPNSALNAALKVLQQMGISNVTIVTP